jgi:hypothetical protein
LNREAFQINDGRTVTPHQHHSDVWMLDGNRVTVNFSDDTVVVVDEIGREVHRGPARHGRQRASKRARTDLFQKSEKSLRSLDRSRGDAAARFVTLNTFVDQVMRRLSPVESLVWIVAFRDCRNGQSSTSSTDLATRTGCGLRTVKAAVQSLCKAGLMTPVILSRHKGQASIYAVTTQPHKCVPKLPSKSKRTRSRTGAGVAPVASHAS